MKLFYRKLRVVFQLPGNCVHVDSLKFNIILPKQMTDCFINGENNDCFNLTANPMTHLNKTLKDLMMLRKTLLFVSDKKFCGY